MCRINLAVGALLIFLLAGASFSQNEAQEEWKRKLEERRAQKSQQTEEQIQNVDTETAETDSAEETGTITLNGKVIKTKRKKTPPAPPPVNQSTPGDSGIQSASGSVSNATPSIGQTTQVAPVPTPAMVKIKKTKIIGGKILTVEIEVTPTPGPALSSNPSEATSIAEAPVPSATGYMLEVMRNLQGATKSPTGSLRFDAKMIATLREEFMKRKDEPNTAKVLAATQAIKVQSDLQRLSSIARGGNIDAEMAETLLKVLYPPAPKKIAIKSDGDTAQATEELAASGEQNEQPVAETMPAENVEQPQYYVDPETGQYYYSDGTPVYSTEQQQIQYYYDQDGNLYYEQDGQIYYLDNNQQ